MSENQEIKSDNFIEKDESLGFKKAFSATETEISKEPNLKQKKVKGRAKKMHAVSGYATVDTFLGDDLEPTISSRSGFNTFSTYDNATADSDGMMYRGMPLDDSLPSFSLSDALAYKSDFKNKNVQLLKKKVPGKLRPGFCFILNHALFENPKYDRVVGSDKDMEAINRVLKDKLQLKIQVYPNYRVDQVRQLAQRIQNQDFTEYSCVVIIILSHGGRHEEIMAYDETYKIDDDILFPMLKNDTLKDKPKIFFVQACKGSFGKDNQPDIDGPPEMATDIFKIFSTFEGFVSWRTENGSLFIQTLCKHLELSGLKKDVQQIADDVRNDLLDNYGNHAQVSAVLTTLRKPFKFGDYVVPRPPFVQT